MKFGKFMAAAAAVSMMAAPVVAQEASASRAAAGTDGASQLGGDDRGATIGVIFALAAFTAFLFLNDEDDDDRPTSP